MRNVSEKRFWTTLAPLFFSTSSHPANIREGRHAWQNNNYVMSVNSKLNCNLVPSDAVCYSDAMR